MRPVTRTLHYQVRRERTSRKPQLFDAGERPRGPSQPNERIQNSWSTVRLFVICVTGVFRTADWVLSLSPLQFGAEHAEESLFHAQQSHRVARAMADYPIALVHRYAYLAIDTEEGRFASGLHQQLNLGFVSDDQWPMGQRMRAHRGHHE